MFYILHQKKKLKIPFFLCFFFKNILYERQKTQNLLDGIIQHSQKNMYENFLPQKLLLTKHLTELVTSLGGFLTCSQWQDIVSTKRLACVFDLPRAESENTWLSLKVQVHHDCHLQLTPRVYWENVRQVSFFGSVGLRNRSEHTLQTSKKTLSYQSSCGRGETEMFRLNNFPEVTSNKGQWQHAAQRTDTINPGDCLLAMVLVPLVG